MIAAEVTCLTKKGVPCVFPFMLAGDYFLGCTDFQEPSKKIWCATKVKKRMFIVQNDSYPLLSRWMSISTLDQTSGATAVRAVL